LRNNKQMGFTLIELLVVIAIIGILASIVMVSLNSARNKGADTAIKANLKAVMTQAEMVYDTNSSYAAVCADTTVVKALTSADSASGGATVCNNRAADWAASSALKSSNFWCVDSTGNNKPVSANLAAGAYVCP